MRRGFVEKLHDLLWCPEIPRGCEACQRRLVRRRSIRARNSRVRPLGMVVRRRIDGHDLQAQTPDSGDAYVDVFGGRLPVHRAALVQLLTVAPHLEEDAPKGPDFVIDPDIGGERLARPLPAKLDGPPRMGAKSSEGGGTVQRPGTPVAPRAPTLALNFFDPPLFLCPLRPR